MTPVGSPRVYNRENSQPRQRDLACHHCAMDQHIEGLRATAIARGPVFLESPYDHKQQIPTPLPPAHGHTMIPFQPTSSANPGRAFGVSMADILDFRPCLKDPDTPVLDNGVQQVFLTLEVRASLSYFPVIYATTILPGEGLHHLRADDLRKLPPQADLALQPRVRHSFGIRCIPQRFPVQPCWPEGGRNCRSFCGGAPAGQPVFARWTGLEGACGVCDLTLEPARSWIYVCFMYAQSCKWKTTDT